MISIIAYIIFIFYAFISNLDNINSSLNSSDPKFQIKWISYDFYEAAGFFALAFMLQNAIVPIYRLNQNQKNNKRDLLISYICVYLIYFFIGFLGYLAILGKPHNLKNNTIFDFFDKKDFICLIIQALFAIFLFCIQPLLIYISKN